LTEWPGGQEGGETEHKTVAVPEPQIGNDGTYKCPHCSQAFTTRQDYLDHYVSSHTSEKVEKGYIVE
jgi:hypothetical protein